MNQVRRVVTGIGPDGSSQVVSDEVLDGSVADGLTLWLDDGAALADRLKLIEAGCVSPTEPPAGGTKCRYAWIPPVAEYRRISAARAVPSVDADGFHLTRSIDFVLVLGGEIHLDLDRESVLLRAGDTVIQQGTNHAWRNETDEPVPLFVVLVSALDRPTNL